MIVPKLLITAVALAAAAAPACAQTQTRTAEVTFDDLELTTEHGRATIDRRVRRAAGQVCGPIGRALAERTTFFRCRSAALSDARAKVAVVIARANARADGIAVAAR